MAIALLAILVRRSGLFTLVHINKLQKRVMDLFVTAFIDFIIFVYNFKNAYCFWTIAYRLASLLHEARPLILRELGDKRESLDIPSPTHSG